MLGALVLLPAASSAEEAAAEPAPIVESHWYDGPLRGLDLTVDVLVVRPLAAITLAAGGALFVPAAILTAPNGRDSITEAWERFVIEPGEYLWARPLGDF